MTKTLFLLLTGLLFTFGAAGVTIAAARQSRNLPSLYRHESLQVPAEHTGKLMRVHMHQRWVLATPQSVPLASCGQPGMNAGCGSDRGNEHPHHEQHTGSRMDHETGHGHGGHHK